MSAVRVAMGVARDEGAFQVDVQAMQDALYDILATGIDPEQQDVPSADIERFLHEHARAAKAASEFHAFFVKHGLNVRTQRPAAAVLELPPISRPEDDGAPAVRLVDDRDSDAMDPDTGARPVPAPTSIPAAGRNILRKTMIAALAACAVAAIGAAGLYGYGAIRELRAELGRASRHAEQQSQAIQALRDHAAGLESSVAATSELVQRVDQKSDLLLETVIANEHASAHRHH
ncbi:MAG: hypothetical protein ACHQ53_10205 [Polyangiales bacterium]